MADNQSSSSEHALMQEITAPLATLPEDPVPLVADVEFPVVMRGYDRGAVDAYVRRVTQLVRELSSTRSPEAVVRRALERVGGEVSGILQRAHETAEQIAAQSRRDAEDRLETARREAATLFAEGERRAKDLDAETDRIWAERHRLVEDTRQLAGQLLALAESAAERFPAEDVGGTGEEPALDDDATAPTTAFPVQPEPGAPFGPSGEYELEEPPEWEGEPGDADEPEPGDERR
jgi:DivIVA domain-containing protein